jgi:hypothetical protein
MAKHINNGGRKYVLLFDEALFFIHFVLYKRKNPFPLKLLRPCLVPKNFAKSTL